ncbi:MAG: hypothetical protein B7Y35_15710 [Sphingomonadales bacterium 28-64-96]|nr:MAG: hypothetical protein B7Y35_15710 [Sphingomonadales bacterium 28-64-96]
MGDEEAVALVVGTLSRYVSSPSLRHIREPQFVRDVAREIVKKLLRRSRVWKKWEGEREPFLRSAANCWIPVEDLRAFLNDLPGPSLTMTDVAERLRAIHEEVREGCLALYQREKADGTELPAIVGALQTYVEEEEQRLRLERQARLDAARLAEKAALELRYTSGADCKWTPVNGSKALYCRVNGRSYRLSPTLDKRWELHRVSSLDDKGILVGRYAKRADVTKALSQVAYQPDFRV